MRGILIRTAVLLTAVAICGTAQANVVVVNAGGNAGLAFSPQTVTIAQGDTVVFVNKGGYHNVAADDGSFTCAVGCKGDARGDTGAPSSANWTFSLTFSKPGTIGYYCVIHGAPGQGMFGTIVVQAPPVPAPGLGARCALLLGLLLATLAAWRLRRRA